MDAVEVAEYDLDMAKETLYLVVGSHAEANAQAELARAEAHYDAAMQAFDDWISSSDGVEYGNLEEMM
jgi:hypothetical protein